ncbi:hypothetical protein Tco_1183002 [Tanacetum coccineum]
MFRQQRIPPEVPSKNISRDIVLNMTLENKAHYESEKRRIQLILTELGDEINSTELMHVQNISRNVGSHREVTTRDDDEMIINNFTVATMQMNPDQAQNDKIMQKNLALIAKYFKRTLQTPITTTSELPQTTKTRMWILIQETILTIRLDSLETQMAENVVGWLGKLTAEILNEQSDWLADTDEEIDEQEVPNADSGTDA